MTNNKKEKNVLKVLVTKNLKLFVYNVNTRKFNAFRRLKPGNKVQFYVRTYFNGDNAKFVKIKKIEQVPDYFDENFFDNL